MAEKEIQGRMTIQELLRTSSESETILALIKIAASAQRPYGLKVNERVEGVNYDFIRARSIYELKDFIRVGKGTRKTTRKAILAIKSANDEKLNLSNDSHNHISKEAAQIVLSKIDKSVIIANGPLLNKIKYVAKTVKNSLKEHDF